MQQCCKVFLLLSFIVLATSCHSGHKKDMEVINSLVDETKQEFAPDKRVALFNLELNSQGSEMVIKGESNLPDAIKALKEKLNQKHIIYTDSIELLPSTQLAGRTYGLIQISVANLRGKPAHSSELVTQATLGTPVEILKAVDSWYLIQTPDRYLSWVDGGGITRMSKEEFLKWKATRKVIFTKTMGQSFSQPDENSQVVSDMVAGGVIEFLSEENNFFKIRYPDGRMAFINKNDAQDYDVWLAGLDPSQESLVSTSKKLMGVPYLWGGTSTKGVDCSGFTKTVYFLNGMVLPRDASQQIHTGKAVDKDRDFDKLLPGDLLFFGKPPTDSTKERVIHVGMWIGNNEFIHSSGRVLISSVDSSADNFDEYNLNRYLRSNRYLKEPMDGLIELAKTPVFKD
ncbi:glycoside hydrolase [Arenibacter sp. H213]|uniref:NlpC/P60 family protein n=1 Tax=Arenibacter antarcticus TaxID=2040469 RepID=A0ABW5VD20_9FLAO|nr:SH3 domain-containing C40 family peptidase [Arenibacter sp. H213]MCM4167839.1 glycoside hydrolase [Arenibacter sp. H213]